MINITQAPQQYITDDRIWWMIFDQSSGNIIIAPNQCSGGTCSPFTMVTADTQEELNCYIVNNGLTLPEQQGGL